MRDAASHHHHQRRAGGITMPSTAATAKRKIPTTAEVLAEQRRLAEADRALTKVGASPPTVNFLDQIAPTTSPGRRIKFDGKAGKFILADTKAELSPSTKYVARCDQCLTGWTKFNGSGQKPDQIMELWSENYELPPRQGLGDLDEDKWETGLDSKPRDPWLITLQLVLQEISDATGLFTFTVNNPTGRMCVGTLLRHYTRLRKANAEEDTFPVVQLRTSSYEHANGFQVFVPVLAVVGTTSRADPTKAASFSEEMNDSLADI
jgi:hypothetical protein